MNLTVKTGLVFSVLYLLVAPKTAQALSVEALLANKPLAEASHQTTAVAEEPKPEQKESKAEITPEAPKPVQYVVQQGDSLTIIAEKHQTTWTRVFDKNVALPDPNVLTVGQILTIPLPDEQLEARPLPIAEPVVAQPVAQAATKSATRTTPTRSTAPVAVASSAGNTYARGYCTWYAKSRRPDLPNQLGNAATWVSRAAAMGIPTGSTPRAGAIGQQGNHVVYVESVNGDGTITVSEMNYAGFGVVSSRTASAGAFLYIY